jgi:hypothetical protein
MAVPYGTKSSSHTIQFTQNVVRIYRQTVGDNPSVAQGPPLQLDWTYQETKEPESDTTSEEKHDEDDDNVETTAPRTPYPKPVRRIPLKRRGEIVLASGVTAREMHHYEKMAQVARKKRIKTIQNLNRAELEERMEEIQTALTCWKKSSSNALVKKCYSLYEKPPVQVSQEHPCTNCSQRALNDVDKAFYKMYKCDGNCK